MGYDVELTNAAQNLVEVILDHGMNSTEYQDAWRNYLSKIKAVALDERDDVLIMENPYDSIMESIADGDLDWVPRMLDEFAEMVETLEEIGYYKAFRWRTDYEKCLAEYNAVI